MDLVIGLDVGTTAVKALLVGPRGELLGSASSGCGMITPHEGWVEQDPEALWQSTVDALTAVAGQVGEGDRIVALSQSSQAGTTIPVDNRGVPTYNAISWMDMRAHKQAQAAIERWGAEFIRTTTGWAVIDGLPLQHIAWLRDERPDVFAATRHFMFVNDFIGQRLTGQRCMNPSDASITQLFDISTGDWHDGLLSTAGITREQLSSMQPSGAVVGQLTPEASEATGLPLEAVLVNGAHDQYCAAVAMGVTRPGLVLLSCGTAWVVLAVPDSAEAGLRGGLAVSRHAVAGRFGAIHSLGGVGRSLEWMLDTMWPPAGGVGGRDELYREVNAAAAGSPPGAGGLLFFTLAGGHSGYGPTRGSLLGLTLSHSRGDIARAVMEGIAFELRWALEQIGQAGLEIGELRMVGGAAKSSVWPSIVADVSGVAVVLPTIRDAASQGAAILAGVGAGLWPGLETAGPAALGQVTRLEPSSHTRSTYERAFARYRRFSEVLSRDDAPALA